MATSRTGTTKYKLWRLAVLRNGRLEGITHCPTLACRVLLDYAEGKKPNSAEPDHIIPYANGGQDVVENGRVLCRQCNQSKGNRQAPGQPKARQTQPFVNPRW